MDGIYQFSKPRVDMITDSGMAIPPTMGTAIAINFQLTSGGRATITAISFWKRNSFVVRLHSLGARLQETRAAAGLLTM